VRIADLNTGAAQLREALDALERAWSEARQHWNDANTRHLEENHLQVLRRELASAFPAIEQLSGVLAQAERDCEPW
jgi:hypothetical protein